jgi:urea carboxylase-associated protein 2
MTETSLDRSRIVYQEELRGGQMWSRVVRRGHALRVVDLEGRANVAALFYNAADPLERYNMADTLKAQHTAYLTRGYVCYSDMGRVMCSVTDDTRGWHDTLCGVTNAAMVRKKYGEARYQEHRNDYHRNGYDGFLTELGKYGLGKRDLAANINFFSKVTADEQGALQFHAGHCAPGGYIDLRFEMNTLVVLAACQHPLDPAASYQPKDVRLTTWHSRPAPRNDPCRTRCPENERGFRNTEVWCR